MQKILLLKETRANEARVALIPEDVKVLVDKGCTVFVEQCAGKLAGFSDAAYEEAGATIRTLSDETEVGYRQLFTDITMVVRAKRASREREKLENISMAAGTILIGSLDPLETNSPHMAEYQRAKLKTYSIDQLKLPVDDPMNILSAMSRIAGKLSMLDAISKFKGKPRNAVIIGYGSVGQTALVEALRHDLNVTVVITNSSQTSTITSLGGESFILDRNLSLNEQQKLLKPLLSKTDLVITSARRANEIAPILIPRETLQALQAGTVVVDMALSEGGNVEGSEHDETHILGNEVIVTNTSGYPKACPHESSILWSRGTLLFILQLLQQSKR